MHVTQNVQQLERSSLELASQLDLVICHSMEKLLDLTDGLVVESDATMRRKTKSRVKMYDLSLIHISEPTRH